MANVGTRVNRRHDEYIHQENHTYEEEPNSADSNDGVDINQFKKVYEIFEKMHLESSRKNTTDTTSSPFAWADLTTKQHSFNNGILRKKKSTREKTKKTEPSKTNPKIIPEYSKHADTRIEESMEVDESRKMFFHQGTSAAAHLKHASHQRRKETSTHSSASATKTGDTGVLPSTSRQDTENTLPSTNTMRTRTATPKTAAGVFSMGYASPTKNKKKQNHATRKSFDFDALFSEHNTVNRDNFLDQARVSKNLKDSVSILTDGIAKFPEDGELRYMRSSAYLQLGDVEKALVDCFRILQSHPSHSKAFLRCMKIFRQTGCYAYGQEWINCKFALRSDEASQAELISEFELVTDLMNLDRDLRGYLEQNIKSFASCGRRVERLVASSPVYPMANFMRVISSAMNGVCCKDLLRYIVTARDSIVRFEGNKGPISNFPNIDNILISQALRNMTRAGYENEAEALLQNIIIVFQESTCIDLLELCMKEQTFQQRLKNAKTVANKYFDEKLYDKAIVAYGEALLLDPSYDTFNAILLCNRAAAYMALRHFELAEEDCTNALRKSPKYNRARIRRARSRLALHRYADAVTDFEVAYEAEPTKSLEQEIANVKARMRPKTEHTSYSHSRGSIPKYSSKNASYSHPREGEPNYGSSKNSYQQKHYRNSYSQSHSGKSSTQLRETLHREPSHYELLGVVAHSTEAEIRKAYLKKVLTCHPDKTDNPQLHEVFKKVAAAYEILRDKGKRRIYDIELKVTMRRC